MFIKLNYSFFYRLFCGSVCIISLSACTEAIITEEQSQSFNSFIPTNEIIRVIADQSITSKDPFSDYNWNYVTQAKIKTEQIFARLGYFVIDTGLAPANQGNPTLVAVINAQQNPLKKNSIHFSMKLYKPLSTQNSLLLCDKNQQNHNICISPKTIIDAQELFTASCNYSGTANVAFFIMKYCVKSAFATYPQSSHQRIIYTTKEQPLVKDLDKA